MSGRSKSAQVESGGIRRRRTGSRHDGQPQAFGVKHSVGQNLWRGICLSLAVVGGYRVGGG
jgi:hypothetical protein